MGDVFLLGILLAIVLCWNCHASTLKVTVIEMENNEHFTLICNVSSTDNVTRWTYLAGPTETSIMRYQNGVCSVSQSDDVLNDGTFSYACNSTVYMLTIFHSSSHNNLNNRIFACRDALRPDGTGSTWIIKIKAEGSLCSYCEPEISFKMLEVIEGDNVTMVCTLAKEETGANWNLILRPVAAIGVQNGQCTSSGGSTFLDNTSKYVYTCNSTVYQVTILNLQRTEHNDMYMCTPIGQAEGKGSNWIIKVKAPVTSVTLEPAKNLVNVNDNTAIKFICTTSTARPTASVYWYRHPNGKWQNVTQITDNITTANDYNDLSITTSILRFVPTRQNNDIKIFCTANNSVNTSPVSSKKLLLNVLYKAEDPYITQGKENRVRENTPGTLSCTAKGGNPTPTLFWSCNNVSPTNQSTINSNGNTTTTLIWNVSRTHEGKCTCTFTQTNFTTATIDVSVVVLYPPSVPAYKVNGSNADGDIYFIKGNSRTIKCTADSKPSPDRYTWTGPAVVDSINIQSLSLIDIKKTDAGKYKCSVHNTMNPSSGSSVVGINSRTVNVVVLYPPSAMHFVYGNERGQTIFDNVIYVIQGDTFNILCKVEDGNPSSTIIWNGQNNNTSVLTVNNITASSNSATCTATNNMKETNRPVVHGSISATIRFNILVRPTIDKCEFYYNHGSTNVITFLNGDMDNLKIIENESFTLNCSAKGKPTPTVRWKTPQRSSVLSSSVTVNNMTRQRNGDYVFIANNQLTPSYQDIQEFTVNKTVSVQVLYAPAVLSMDDISKLKGQQLNVTCNYTAGLPNNTSIKWTRGFDNRKWTTSALTIGSLKKNDTGVYTCTASNTMQQSGDNKYYIGQNNQSFHLDVQYAAGIKSFTIDGSKRQTATVNESDPVIFTCNAESNPTAVMTVDHGGKTLITVTSDKVEYNISDAICSDAGVYKCSAKNVHNDHNGVHNTMQLFVNCYPRVGEDNDVNVTSEKNNTVTIVFNVIAYPVPTFTWYQLVDGNWTLVNEGVNYIIWSENQQSNLTIRSVGTDEFTSYKVIVKNDIGRMEQLFTLSPYDKPDSPTGLRHIEDQTTTSSIHIEWEPGFDNGPPQTFHIKYKKSSDTVWNYLNVTDNGEPTMNITLTGLLENTQYDVIIFASNVKGNTTESNVLITRTKAIQNPTPIPGALIGGIAGGVTGCIVIVIVIVFIIRRYSQFKDNGADRQNVRRSVSDDSDDEDGLVDNPMYASSSNVSPVASTSVSTSTDINSTPVKPNKTNAAGNGDIYSVVNKTKGQGKGGKGKSTNEKGKQKEGDVYENVELENNPNKKDTGKQLPPKPPAEQPKLKIVNQDGLIYADLVFKDKPPGGKMVILGDDSTPYDLVDFTKKAEPLPESDEEEQK